MVPSIHHIGQKKRQSVYPNAVLFIFVLVLLSPPAWAARILESTLTNGLKIVLQEEQKAPVVTFQVWYRVGSRNEAVGKTGLSHFLEHMMFKGTPRFGKGEFSRIVAQNGGTENAFTGNDYTAYFENFASDRIHLSLELESDRMQNALIDHGEFQLEREVVKEERRSRTDDDPTADLIENLYAIAFLTHPYHNPIIGWMSDIDHLTREEMVHHYRKYYVPNNATLVIVGAFDSKKLLPLIQNAFEKIPASPLPPDVVSLERPQVGERRIIIKREAQLPFIFIGYHVPNFKDPDVYPLAVLSQILSTGKSSRLYRGVVYDQQIALDAGGHYDDLTADSDLFYVYAVVQAGSSPDQVEKGVLDQINRLKTEAVPPDELQKAKNQIASSHIFASDSNFYQAMQIGKALTVGASVQYVTEFTENIQKVTAVDILHVAKKYLTDDTKSVGILLPTQKEIEQGMAPHLGRGK